MAEEEWKGATIKSNSTISWSTFLLSSIKISCAYVKRRVKDKTKILQNTKKTANNQIKDET